MASEFGPGRLTAEWLNDNAGTDPWLLTTSDPFDEGHRDAFMGNGFIGQRIGVTGDAADYGDGRFQTTPSGCVVHGLWNEIALMPPPNWALLEYHDGDAAFTKDAGEWLGFEQQLDLKRAILTSSVNWQNGAKRTRIESRFHLSRSRPNVAVLERSIIPEFDGSVSVVDRIDGDFIDDATDRRSHVPDDPTSEMSLELTMGPRKRRVALQSILLLNGTEDCSCEPFPQERSVARQISFRVRPGERYCVTKIVALSTDAEAPNPWSHARMLVRGAAQDPSRLECEHVEAWAEIWQHWIEVPHPRLQSILNATLYQLYSNLREGGRWSLGPAGLSGNAWKGHAFWDSDLWMFPGLAVLNPVLARDFVDYRGDTLDGARRNARAEGHDGAMFAWESAEFGDETIPQLVYHHQHHVNSDVALAQWFFYLVSGDDDFLRDNAADVIIESARFWVSWAEYNAEQDRYEIRRVCCADEFAEIQDNNAYTSYSAVKTIRLAQRVGEILGIELPENWDEVASKMWIPFDEKEQRYLEYEDYAGQTIKQADTSILVYPYEMPMSDEVKANIVDYYRSKYPKGNIMMAAAFDGIVDCELGRNESGWESMLRLMPHFRAPFLLVSESPKNDCISFQTGLGGLLQLVLMGFAGIRLHESELVVRPCLPPELPWMHIHSMCFEGETFDLKIEGPEYTIDRK